MVPQNLVLERRGGGDIATDTIESSSYPTTPPASTETHFQSIPTIDGSEGGFIGLVVGLGVIFIASCAGIFFLLRHRKHGGRSIHGKSGELGIETPRRRGTLFGYKSRNPHSAGWVRAPDGEEDEERDVWDASMHDSGPYDPVPGAVKMERSVYGDTMNQNQKDTIKYEAPERPRDFPDPFDVDEYANSNTKSGVQNPTTVRPFSPSQINTETDSYPPYSYPYTARVDSHFPEGKRGSLHYSLASSETALSTHSLPNGTKFKEEI